MSSSLSSSYTQLNRDEKELVECFLNTFQLLSEKQKKIWQLIQWYSINYRLVFPSHEKIAEIVGCCRDTVIQAIKKFKQFGWLVSLKRCYRSSLYFIHDCLKKFDTRKSETFRVNPTEEPTEKPTENPTLYNTYSQAYNVRETLPREAVQSLKDEKENILRMIGISDSKDIWCLSRFSTRILRMAAEDEKSRKAKGPIRNLAAWITDRCKELKQKYGM